jgi:hypothetical protein
MNAATLKPHALAVARTIEVAARALQNDVFTRAYVLEECASKGILERGVTLESASEEDLDRLMQWITGVVDIELGYEDRRLFELLSGWVAQARIRMDRDRHRDALAALDLVELTTTRLQLISKQRVRA